MKTINVSQAEGPVLDWLVSTITNPEWTDEDRAFNTFNYVDVGDANDEPYSPSTDWSQGGPIIEQEKITIRPVCHAERTEGGADLYRQDGWTAHVTPKEYWITPRPESGPTPLIAAMRCFCVSKLGETVEVPEELA
jgi:hypothetical protein